MKVKEKLKVMDDIAAANKRHVEDWQKEKAALSKITGVLVDVKHEQVKVVTVDKELASYYRLIDCRCIDVVRRHIGSRSFLIVADDEGALVDNPKISAISGLGEVMLVGNLFVVGFDGQDDITSLSEQDAAFVMQKVRRMCTRQHPFGYPMLTQVCY